MKFGPPEEGKLDASSTVHDGYVIAIYHYACANRSFTQVILHTRVLQISIPFSKKKDARRSRTLSMASTRRRQPPYLPRRILSHMFLNL